MARNITTKEKTQRRIEDTAGEIIKLVKNNVNYATLRKEIIPVLGKLLRNNALQKRNKHKGSKTTSSAGTTQHLLRTEEPACEPSDPKDYAGEFARLELEAGDLLNLL